MSDELQVARVVLIRHGQSASNAGGWLSGLDTCGGLTDLGVRQAEALRDRLAADMTLAPDRVLVSTMRRAVHTAEIIAAPTDHEPEQFADLIERTSGEAEGLTIAEYTAKYGKPPWTDWENPLSPGGESGEEFSGRVRSALNRVASEAMGSTVWVVCHGGVIMSNAVDRWAGDTKVSLANLPLHSPQNTSVSEWGVDGSGNWRMARFNDHTHLVGVSDGAAPAAI
ncbi:MAG: histidine phosphatase family protein [Ilumatobacter sp.]